MFKKKYPKKYYGSGYSLLKMLLALIVYFVLIYLFADQLFQTILTVIFIPLIMTIFTDIWKKLIDPRCCYIDAFLFDYDAAPFNDSWVWLTPDQDAMLSVVSLKNIGTSTIRSIRICVNPTTPKMDTWYVVDYPIKENDNLLVVLPIEKEIIDTLFVMPMFEGGDAALTLSGKKIRTKQGITFSQIEKSINNYKANRVAHYTSLIRFNS